MSKHVQRASSDSQPQIASFLWLLRDMDLHIGSSSPTEWLLRKLQAPRCKDIYEALTNTFSAVDCAFLPPPAVENEVLQNIFQRKDDLTPHFNNQMEKLKSKILSAIEPKQCEGGPFTGFSMASLIETCVVEINHRAAVPALEATWKVAIELQLQQFASELATDYEKEMASALKNLFPLEEGLPDSSDTSTLMGIHNDLLQKKCSALKSKLLSLVPMKDVCCSFWQVIRDKFISTVVESDCNGQVKGGKLLTFVHENYKVSSELCTKTYTMFYDQIVASKLRCAIAEGIPYDIAPDVATFEEKYNRIAHGPAKSEVFSSSRIKSEIEECKLKLIPGHIEELRVIGISSDCVKLTWCKPSINPTAAHGYEVYMTDEDGSLLLIETTNQCHALLKNLKSNKQYTFVVRAKNNHFLGSYVSHVSAKTTLHNVARSAVGIGTLFAFTVGSPVVFPTIFSIGTLSSIRDDVREKKYGSAAAKGAGLVLLPLALPIGVLGTIFVAPAVAIDSFMDNGPVGDLSTSAPENGVDECI